MASERLITLMEILQVYADRYVRLATNFALFENLLETHDFTDPKNSSDLDFMIGRLKALGALCVDGDLPMTKMAVDGGLEGLSTYREPNANKVVIDRVAKHFFEQLQGRLADELSIKIFFQLPHSRKELFENPLAKWESIAKRFPQITRDVEEMNKCFALSRYTASMFHAMQVAELGAIELGIFIDVEDPMKGWGSTQHKLQSLIKAGRNHLPPKLTGKWNFLEQMGREIDSMVLSWRHKIDHAANRLAIIPNTDFTPDIAEHIKGAIRIFMLRLQEGMPA